MIIAELPDNEEMRLLDLTSYGLQDTNTEEDFDQLSELMAEYFNCPIALITVIDREQQWFKGKKGTTETGNTRDLSFCSHTLLQDEVMVVENAVKDERFFDNPVVAGAFNIRFYAGAPIVSTEGYKLGTVCIYDTKPKRISAIKKNALTLFSRQVTKLLELRKKNMLLRQRAEEMITFKSGIFARFIQTQEEDKKAIAFNLHEDFAQGIAASLMILKMAKQKNQQSTDLISQASRQLKEVLVNIRSLSYTITPHIPDWVATDQLVLEFIEKVAVAYPFKIMVENSGHLKNGSADITLCMIRIIEQWLKVLLKKKSIRNVHIQVAYGEQLVLSILDDGAEENMVDRKKDVFESIVYDRAHAQGGTVEISSSSAGKNLLKVLLPLINKKAGNTSEPLKDYLKIHSKKEKS
jgi:GAF domain-containing protein